MAARRPRKTDHGVSDFDALLNAIKAVLIDEKSINAAAKLFNFNRRSFYRYVNKFKAEVPDIKAVGDDELLKVVRRIATYSGCGTKLVFDEDQEAELMEYYYELSTTEMKQLAYQFAKMRNIAYPASWDADQMAGKQWYYGFMLRQGALTSDMSRATSLSSVPSSVGPLSAVSEPEKNTILTSLESTAVLKERQEKRAAAKEKQGENQKMKATPAKRTKKKTSTSSEDSGDECMICSKKLAVNLKCVDDCSSCELNDNE